MSPFFDEEPNFTMIRSTSRRIARLFEPSMASLERLAARSGCSLQHRMDIDESSHWFSPKFRQLAGGFSPPGEQRDYQRVFISDRVRSDMIILLLREIIVSNVAGSLAELGVHLGWSARLIHHYCPERRFYLLDTFKGFETRDLRSESIRMGFNERPAFEDTSIELVRKNIQPIGNTLEFVPGWFPGSATDSMREDRFAFVHLDADLEAPINAGLEFFWPRLTSGGMIVVHDYNSWPGARTAVDSFKKRERIVAIPMPDKSGSIVLAK